MTFGNDYAGRNQRLGWTKYERVGIAESSQGNAGEYHGFDSIFGFTRARYWPGIRQFPVSDAAIFPIFIRGGTCLYPGDPFLGYSKTSATNG